MLSCIQKSAAATNKNHTPEQLQQLADKAKAENREIVIKRIGSGWNQNADLVAHPEHGITIRKSMQKPYTNVNHWWNDPDTKVLREIKKMQDTAGRDLGFARVHGFDPKRMVTYSAYEPGTPFSDKGPFKKLTAKRDAVTEAATKVKDIKGEMKRTSIFSPRYYGLMVDRTKAELNHKKQFAEYAAHKATHSNNKVKLTNDQKMVVQLLHDRGMKRVFDHNNPWNVLDTASGPKIIDIGGDYINLKAFKKRVGPSTYFRNPNYKSPENLGTVKRLVHDVSNFKPEYQAAVGAAAAVPLVGLGAMIHNSMKKKPFLTRHPEAALVAGGLGALGAGYLYSKHKEQQ